VVKKVGIYGWRCTENGKWYIGQSVDIESRRGCHLYRLRGGKHPNRHLQASFDKHGAESFEFHIVEEAPEDMLDIRERSWIAYLNSTDQRFGYNLDTGGWANRQRSPETRAKISAARLGKRLSPESRAKLSAWRTGRKNGPMSIEQRAKISAANKGKSPSLEHRAKLSVARKRYWVNKRQIRKDATDSASEKGS